MRLNINIKDLSAVFTSILLSVFMVAVVAYGASVIDTASVGSGTSTPGVAAGVKGAGLFEGFVHADYFKSTSTNPSWISANLGLGGTTTPGAALDVQGAGIFEGFVHADYFKSTSTNPSWLLGRIGLGTTTPSSTVNNDGGITVEGGGLFGDFVMSSYLTATSSTATSTIKTGMIIASSSVVDAVSGRIALGTTTIPDSDVANTEANDPTLTISGLGSTYNATGTLYITNAGAGGGQIILKSVDGFNCAAISAATVDAAFSTGITLTAEVVACPR